MKHEHGQGTHMTGHGHSDTANPKNVGRAYLYNVHQNL